MAQISVSHLRELQNQLNVSIDSYINSVESNVHDSHAQHELDIAARTMEGIVNLLASTVRNPIYHVAEIGFQPIVNMALRIAIDLDLFSIIESSVTLDELVQKTGADRQLLFRLMRLLATIPVFEEKPEKVYSSTQLSKTLRLPPLRDWIKACFDSSQPIWQHTPAFLRDNGYQDIANLKSNPTTSSTNCKNYFEWLARDPAREADFASSMKIQENAPQETIPQYPFAVSDAESSKDSETVFVVDVGGGQGQFLGRLAEKIPNMPGHNVLQDLPSVVAGVSKDEQQEANFRAMAHDFFQPQVVSGAKYYHLRMVLHDWPDKEAVQILTQLRPAMKKGYSKVLVYDRIFPEMDVPLFEAECDIAMWLNCGRERTQREHEANFAKAGLKLVRVVKPQIGYVSVMECVRDDEEQMEGVES